MGSLRSQRHVLVLSSEHENFRSQGVRQVDSSSSSKLLNSHIVHHISNPIGENIGKVEAEARRRKRVNTGWVEGAVLPVWRGEGFSGSRQGKVCWEWLGLVVVGESKGVLCKW